MQRDESTFDYGFTHPFMKQNAAAKNRQMTELLSAGFPQMEVDRPLLQLIQSASENGEMDTKIPPTTANSPRSKSSVTPTAGWMRSFPTKKLKVSAIKDHNAEMENYIDCFFLLLVFIISISCLWRLGIYGMDLWWKGGDSNVRNISRLFRRTGLYPVKIRPQLPIRDQWRR